MLPWMAAAKYPLDTRSTATHSTSAVFIMASIPAVSPTTPRVSNRPMARSDGIWASYPSSSRGLPAMAATGRLGLAKMIDLTLPRETALAVSSPISTASSTVARSPPRATATSPPPRRITPFTRTSVAFTIASMASKMGTNPSASMNPAASLAMPLLPLVLSGAVQPGDDRRPGAPDGPVLQHPGRAVAGPAAGQEGQGPQLAVGLGLPGVLLAQGQHVLEAAGGEQVEHPAVPGVVAGVLEAVLGRLDPALDQPRGQPGHGHEGDPPAELAGGQGSRLGDPAQVARGRVQVAGDERDRPGAVGVDQPAGDHGAGVDREAVVAGPAGLEPHVLGLAGPGLGQLDVDAQVVVEGAVVVGVPVLVDVTAARVGIDLELVAEHGEPLGRQDHEGVRPGRPEVLAGLPGRVGQQLPARRRLGRQQVRHPGDQRRPDHGHERAPVIGRGRSASSGPGAQPGGAGWAGAGLAGSHSITALPVPMMVP